MSHLPACLLVALLLTGAGQPAASAPATPRELYTAAVAREQALRAKDGKAKPGIGAYRAAVSAYDEVVRRFPQSGYVDNALWQGAALAREAFERFGQPRDRATARRMLALIVSDYPVSPFVPKAREALKRLDEPPPTAAAPAPRPTKAVRLRAVTRLALAGRVRVTLDLDGATTYHSERVENPPRVLLDLAETSPGPGVPRGTLTYQDKAADYVRVGIQPNHVTRVVISLDGVKRYRISSSDQPYRIVVDCERTLPAPGAPPPAAARRADSTRTPSPREAAPLPSRRLQTAWTAPPTARPIDAALLRASETPPPAKAAASTMTTPKTATPPGLPAAAAAPAGPPTPSASGRSLPPATPAPSAGAAAPRGSFSMARQLGLGASRIVIDPGHGGHDPGALGKGISEADVVLDVALRLEKLLRAAGVDVVLTRRTDEYVPLEDRPAIATRNRADLFLSIHANASRSHSARGVESYFLNFSTDPDAEAVAARENAATSRTINNLPDILKAITLNNKLDESRDFAADIQRSLVTELRGQNTGLRNLGVKQAPFVVLIGADMPSVLVEIAFITNPQEGRLLKRPAYRQRIAQALFDAIREYQQSLKSAAPATR